MTEKVVVDRFPVGVSDAKASVAGPGAIGAMRTFVHLSKPDDPYVRKAQAGLWEWDAERQATDQAQTR